MRMTAGPRATSSPAAMALSLPKFRDRCTGTIRGSAAATASRSPGPGGCLEAEGLLAVCIQHEMDHLQGILFDSSGAGSARFGLTTALALLIGP